MQAVGIKINNKGKICYFDSNNYRLKKKLTVIVDTEKGLQLGKVILFKEVSSDEVLGKVVRISNKRDYRRFLDNAHKAKLAINRCNKLIKDSNLNMKIIDAEYNLERTQLTFKFTSEDRVDFRQLAKDLGAILKTRIELRQIGIRDKAREVGGLGICGRKTCCSNYICNFDSVSINMAKNQSLSLNPSKINGVCGRLLCCLKYENDNYCDNKDCSLKDENNICCSDNCPFKEEKDGSKE